MANNGEGHTTTTANNNNRKFQNFLLKVVVSDLNAYHQFSSGKLAALPNVGQIKSTFVLNEIKRSTVFPLL